MNKIGFSLRYSIYSFLISFALFLVLIYTEDILFLDPFNSKNTQILPETFFLKRILLVFVLSIVSGLITFSFLIKFQKEIYIVHRLILDLGRKNYIENEIEIPSFINEFTNLKQVLKSTYYTIISNENRNINNTLKEFELIHSKNILLFNSNINIEPIVNIDLSVFPQKSEDFRKDIIGIVPTKEGLIYNITGFLNDSIVNTAYKSKLEFLNNFIKNINYMDEEILINQLANTVKKFPQKGLIFSLGYISNTSNKIIYYNFQSIPVFIFDHEKIIELDSEGAETFPFSKNMIEPKAYSIEKNSYFISFSDYLLNIKNFQLIEFIKMWKKDLLIHSHSIQNSKDIVLTTTKTLENYIKSIHGLENPKEYLSIIVVRKKI
jgi:Arg-Lys translocation region protein phosphatase